CNPKYIAEYLNIKDEYDLVWSLNKKVMEAEDIPKGMRAVRYLSIEYFYEIATAKIIISNHRHNFFKRNRQKYIQTWHSSMRLKKIEGDAPEGLSKGYKKTAKHDSANTDVIISGCEFSTRFFKKSFWYDGEVAKTGTPRIDYLLSADTKDKDKVKTYFECYDNLVLYAPTFRTRADISFYDIDADRIVQAAKEKLGGSYKVLSRLHPNLANRFDELKSSENLLNATTYSDIQELIVASEIVITDYSSLMFDCAFIHKPCILYMPDYDEYTSKERGLYFDIKELPFPKAYTLDELTECIKNFDKSEYDRKIDAFLERIGSYEDGHACERISKIIEKFTKE
ncbi:MAG: CDP-glycerol glycerophosphotransferase family protein, partial [Clostridia bacterium]|nr:CDP-glycerol glycerophosphotransferase family protein [Clostridia bacterium]